MEPSRARGSRMNRELCSSLIVSCAARPGATSLRPPEKPSITAKRMWFDTVAHAHPPAIRAAVDTLGADRIILGTDFPYESGALYTHAITYLSEAGLKKNDLTNILDYNAAAVLGLS